MLRICTTLMRIQIDADPDPTFHSSLRIMIRLSLWCGFESDYFFLRPLILIKVMRICYTGLQTLHGSIVGSHGSNVRLSDFTVRLPRSRFFTLIRIRVRTPKMMRIQISE